MKIIYIANARIPTEKAHGLQISKMCEVLAELGNQVELVVPPIPNAIKEDAFSYYNIKPVFTVTYTKARFTRWMTTPVGYRLFEYSFIFYLFKYLKNKSIDAIITRNIIVALIFGKQYPVFYEMHDFPESKLWLWRHIFKNTTGLIVTNAWKKQKLIDNFNCPESVVHCAPNGFDPKIFNTRPVEIVTKVELGLPSDSFVLGYAGMLKTMGMEKGVATMINSLKELPSQIHLLLVGGSAEDIKEYSKKAEAIGVKERVVFVGRVDHDKMPDYLQIADVLVAPFPDTPHYRNYMSPIKLFEYLASGKPIVTSDLPSIREIIQDSGILIKPGNEDSFCEAVLAFQKNGEKRNEYSKRALFRSKMFTWKNRAEAITEFVKKRI